jgi:hypothetical protein
MAKRDQTVKAALTITDLAIREGIGYQVARERALRGLFGPVQRIAGRLYITTPRTSEPQVSGTGK